jgi:hypothetical protein
LGVLAQRLVKKPTAEATDGGGSVAFCNSFVLQQLRF